eukprot:11764114-Prorocentrum_lima.AAC.1
MLRTNCDPLVQQTQPDRFLFPIRIDQEGRSLQVLNGSAAQTAKRAKPLVRLEVLSPQEQ